MFQIDLLKGEGRPIKSEPWAMAAVSAPSLIPLITAVVLLSSFVGNGIDIGNKTEQISKLDAKIAGMVTARQKRDTAQAQIDSGARSVGEVATAMKMHTQWSDILSDVSKSVPSNVVLYKLVGTRDTRSAAAAKAPNACKFTLLIGAYADTGEAGGRSIQKFIDTLRTSKTFGPRIDTIKPVSNQNGTFAGRDVAVFDIQCDLKSNQ
jgi:hypothetical protein